MSHAIIRPQETTGRIIIYKPGTVQDLDHADFIGLDQVRDGAFPINAQRR